MPGSLISEEPLRAPSALSTHRPTLSTTGSSRATSPTPNHRADPQRTISPSHSRATSPAPKSKHRPSVARHHTTNPQMDGLLSRFLVEEDETNARLQGRISELARELKVRTDALEQAYDRIQTADKLTVDTHKKYLAEASARAKVERECQKLRGENIKAQMTVQVWQSELDRLKRLVESLEAEKAQAQSTAGRAQAVARELEQTMRAGRAGDVRVPEGRGSDDRAKEREYEQAMAIAVKEAYQKGMAEGEASATMKALAAFDKLMESDELNEWDDQAKMSTRNEIQDSTKKPSVEARAKSPEPPKRKWSIRRGSNSAAN